MPLFRLAKWEGTESRMIRESEDLPDVERLSVRGPIRWSAEGPSESGCNPQSFSALGIFFWL